MSTYSASAHSTSSSIVEIDNPMNGSFQGDIAADVISVDGDVDAVPEAPLEWNTWNQEEEDNESDNGWGKSAWANVKEGAAWGEAATTTLEDVDYKVEKIDGVVEKLDEDLGRLHAAVGLMSLDTRHEVDQLRNSFKDLTGSVYQSRKNTRRDFEVSSF